MLVDWQCDEWYKWRPPSPYTQIYGRADRIIQSGYTSYQAVCRRVIWHILSGLVGWPSHLTFWPPQRNCKLPHYCTNGNKIQRIKSCRLYTTPDLVRRSVGPTKWYCVYGLWALKKYVANYIHTILRYNTII